MGKYSKPRGKKNAASRKSAPKRKGSGLTAVLCVITLLLIGVIAGLYFLADLGPSGPSGSLIPENVSIGGVNVGGMTREEAIAAVEDSLSSFAQDMVIELPDTTLTISAADAGVTLNVEAAVDAAIEKGRHVDIVDYLTLNENQVRSKLEAACAPYNSEFTPASATVNGEAPILDTADENFDPAAPCQTITVTTGVPGSHIDAGGLYDQVLAAYAEGTFAVTAEVSGEEPPSTGELAQQLQELYELWATEPLDAILNTETYEASHEIYGYCFDLDAALAQLETLGTGETFEISFEMVAPELTKESLEAVLFKDVLAAYETKHTNNSNRNTNLKLACAAINNMILMPGDQFDYNTALGKRTEEAGYKAADAYSGGQTVKSIGGGICQVSSTLYYCTLIADLQIDTRVAHSYTSSYMPLGMDATVSWGGPHFRFTNNTNYPIRIEAEVSGGYVKIKLLGTDEKDYYVKMEYEVLSNTYAETVTKEYTKDNAEGYKDGQVIQTAYNGCTVQSYKCKYDKETDELISREKEALSKYKKRDKIIVKIVTDTTTPTQTTPPATQAPVPETSAPTEAPATEPKPVETTPPATAAPAATEAPAA